MKLLAKTVAGRARRAPYDKLDVIIIRHKSISAIWRFVKNKEKESGASPRQ